MGLVKRYMTTFNIMGRDSKVTVLMPVYNGEKYLREAIESILNQTFANFEFLIINDGSTDNSADIIKSYDDKRIRYINNGENLQLIAALNKGLDLAQCEYIARMDCDDISLPQRLEKQVNFLDENKRVGICGSWIERFGETEPDIFKYPEDYELIKCNLFFFSTFAHPSIMLRKDFLRMYNLYYDSNYRHAEDFELLQRCSFLFEIRNIPEVLLKYRIHSSSIIKSNLAEHRETLMKIDKKSLSLLGIEADEETLKLHQALCPLRYPPIPENRNFVIWADKWLQQILTANQQVKLYPEPIFSQIIGDRWFVVCKNNMKWGSWTMKKFKESVLHELSAKSDPR